MQRIHTYIRGATNLPKEFCYTRKQRLVCKLKMQVIFATCEVDLHVSVLLIIIQRKSTSEKGETGNILPNAYTFCGCNSQTESKYYTRL